MIISRHLTRHTSSRYFNVHWSVDHDASNLLIEDDATILLPQLLFRVWVLKSVLVDSMMCLHWDVIRAIHCISQIIVLLSASWAITKSFRGCLSAAVMWFETQPGLEEDLETWGVGGHDGNFKFDNGDDNKLAEDVSEINGLGLELEKDLETDAWNQDNNCAERDNQDKRDTFAKGNLDCPEWSNWKNDDQDIQKDRLWQTLEIA